MAPINSPNLHCRDGLSGWTDLGEKLRDLSLVLRPIIFLDCYEVDKFSRVPKETIICICHVSLSRIEFMENRFKTN